MTYHCATFLDAETLLDVSNIVLNEENASESDNSQSDESEETDSSVFFIFGFKIFN